MMIVPELDNNEMFLLSSKQLEQLERDLTRLLRLLWQLQGKNKQIIKISSPFSDRAESSASSR